MTQLFLQLVKEHLDANKQEIQHLAHHPELGRKVVHRIKQLSGQIHAFDRILDIKTFLSEEELERLDDERDDIGTPDSFTNGGS